MRVQVTLKDGSEVQVFEHGMSLSIVGLRGSIPQDWILEFKMALGKASQPVLFVRKYTLKERYCPCPCRVHQNVCVCVCACVCLYRQVRRVHAGPAHTDIRDIQGTLHHLCMLVHRTDRCGNVCGVSLCVRVCVCVSLYVSICMCARVCT